MVEVTGAYKHGRYEKIRLNILHVKSNIKVFVRQDSQPTNTTKNSVYKSIIYCISIMMPQRKSTWILVWHDKTVKQNPNMLKDPHKIKASSFFVVVYLSHHLCLTIKILMQDIVTYQVPSWIHHTYLHKRHHSWQSHNTHPIQHSNNHFSFQIIYRLYKGETAFFEQLAENRFTRSTVYIILSQTECSKSINVICTRIMFPYA